MGRKDPGCSPARRGRTPLPPEFDICLTDGCNLACRYCYFHRAKGGRPKRPRFLTREAVSRGLDLYMAGAPDIEKVSIAGGEPFLDFPLLLDVIGIVRRMAGPGPEIELFTNGTFLSRDRVRKVLDRRVRLVVSIDGPKRVTDRNRVFRRGGKSVFDTVRSKLKTLGPGLLSKLWAQVTFTSETADSLAESVRVLREMGFGQVVTDIDILELWPKAGLARLGKGLSELKALHARSLADGFTGFDQARFGLDFLVSKLEKEVLEHLPTIRELSLAPDGRFYPSGLISAHGPEKKRYRVGSLDAGIDLRAIARCRDEVTGFLRSLRQEGYAACPSNLYFHCRLTGEDPRRLIRSGLEVYKAAGDVRALCRVEDAFEAVLRDRGFGDFSHKPRRVCPDEMRSLAVDARMPTADLRDGLDYFLHSPGKAKDLRLFGRFPKRWDLVCGVALYAVMKARALGKSLSVTVQPEGADVPPERMAFLRDHRMALVLDAKAVLGSARGRKTAGAAREVLGGAVALSHVPGLTKKACARPARAGGGPFVLDVLDILDASAPALLDASGWHEPPHPDPEVAAGAETVLKLSSRDPRVRRALREALLLRRRSSELLSG